MLGQRWSRRAPRSWRLGLVLAVALAVLALHQLSHGRSLVVTDPGSAGHHAPAAAVTTVVMDDLRHALVDAGAEEVAAVCEQLCQHAPMIMVCLMALVLLVHRWSWSGPAEATWWLLLLRGPVIRSGVVPGGSTAPARPSVSLLALGISRT